MIEGLSRLYNYAHRIAIFGDQPQPLDVGAFKRAKSEQSWEHELEAVAGDDLRVVEIAAVEDDRLA